MKIVILTGRNTPATARTVLRLKQISSLDVSAVLLEQPVGGWRQKLRNLRRNCRRFGWRYILERAFWSVSDWLDGRAISVGLPKEARKLRERALPDDLLTLEQVCAKTGIAFEQVSTLNGVHARARLRELSPQLGVVLGTRVLKRETFAIPELGCINLHKGKVPEYRGMPPGYWEIYDQRETAGVTIHFVDEGLDTGDIVAQAELPIHKKDTPATLRKKLDLLGTETLAGAVTRLAENDLRRVPQPISQCKPRTMPSRMQEKALYERLGCQRQSDSLFFAFKTALYLLIFYSGLFWLVRSLRSLMRQGKRAAILLYHRVNDLTIDPLTTSSQRFCEHLQLIRRYYTPMSSRDLVATLRSGGHFPRNAVAIHFDDCYRDVFTVAGACLKEAGVPSTFFISSGYIGTDRVFPHDAEKCPFRLENLQASEFAELEERGIEVAAHTVNHADLGQCGLEQARFEVHQSKADLEARLGHPVTLFSFPYGERRNIEPAVVEEVKNAKFEALFSAYGGFVSTRSDVYNIPRFGVHDEFRGLDLLMEIEGLSLGSLKKKFARLVQARRGSHPATERA